MLFQPFAGRTDSSPGVQGVPEGSAGSHSRALEPPRAVWCEKPRRLRRPTAVSDTALVIIVPLGISCTGNYYSPNFSIHCCDR